MEPPVSVPSAPRQRPAATATPEPLDEPPDECGVLHGFIPNQGDAWTHAQGELSQYFERALTQKDRTVELPVKPLVNLVAEDQPGPIVTEAIGAFLETAGLLGRRTAELHLALAAATDDPDFAPELYSALYQRSEYQSMRNLAGQVFRVEMSERYAEGFRRTSDLVQREQRAIPIKGRIFQPLGHNGPGELLEAHHEESPLGAVCISDTVRVFEQEQILNEIEDRSAGGGIAPFRGFNSAADVAFVLFIGVLGIELDIGAVHRKAGNNFTQGIALSEMKR